MGYYITFIGSIGYHITKMKTINTNRNNRKGKNSALSFLTNECTALPRGMIN